MKKHTLEPGYGEKIEKRGKWEMYPLGPGIWQETLKNVENEKCSLWDLEYGEKTEKREKWEVHTLGPAYGDKT